MGREERLTLGVDLGGTKTEIALVDAAGGITASERRPTHPEKGPDGVIADVVKGVRDCLARSGQTAAGLGVGVAGMVGKETGVVRFAPNLDWREVPLQDRLRQALGMPVVVNNDVRSATWGEWRFGAGKGVDHMVCLLVGTGVGGGIVSSGYLLEGCTNTAGELGHITIVAGGRQCHCLNHGCLEAYTGGWAIAERAREAVSADPAAGQKLVTLAGSLDSISGVTVSRAYRIGDTLASRLVEETANYLAAGVVSLVNAVNPCRVVLGGGVIMGLPEYIAMVERRVRASALPAAVEGLQIVPAALGDKAVAIGAASLARQRILGDSA